MLIDRHFDFVYDSVVNDDFIKQALIDSPLSAERWTKYNFRKNVVCVDVTNIAEWINDRNQKSWSPSEFFCVVPPWELAWYEFKESNSRIKKELLQSNIRSAFTGILGIRVERTDNKEATLMGEKFYNAFFLFNEIDPVKSYLGKGLLLLDDEGRILDAFYYPSPSLAEYYVKHNVTMDVGVFLDHVSPALFGIQFAHCSNVKQIGGAAIPAKLQKARIKRDKEPLFSFRKLVIAPLRKQIDSDSSVSNEAQMSKALHICRGHFAHYGMEWRGEQKAKLFGKYSGSFWVPDHTRGSLNSGMVKKTYEIKPEEKQDGEIQPQTL